VKNCSSFWSVEFVTGALIGIFLSEVAFFVTSIYLHRTLSHRALRLSSTATGTCRVLVWLLTGICPREWVAVHRKHHAFSDKEGDPHSPVLLGYWRVQWQLPVLYRRVAQDQATVARYARDLPPDRFDRLFFDHGWLGLLLSSGVVIAVAGWQVMVIAAVVHGVIYLGGSGAINAIGHRWGRKPYDNLATNNRWLALLVAGEGLHNNHHAAPTSGCFSFKRTEIDPAWLVICLLARMRLATVRHREIRPRPSLRSPSEFGVSG
jgi:stearoyl-CoA desaturase (Delta-9 desaturase)